VCGPFHLELVRLVVLCVAVDLTPYKSCFVVSHVTMGLMPGALMFGCAVLCVSIAALSCRVTEWA
jgi:hypothetical protein